MLLPSCKHCWMRRHGARVRDVACRRIHPLLAKMPHDLFKQDVPALLALKRGDFRALITQITPSVIDRIARER